MSSEMTPLISVVIPLYNTEQYIACALESCLNQTYQNLEIIVIDDGSSDQSVDIVSDLMKRDDRIKLLRNEENLGTFATRIRGIEACNGEFVAFLDSDDYLLPNACELLLGAFHENIDFVDCGYFLEGKGEICIHYENYLHAGLGALIYKLYRCSLLLKACALCVEVLGEYPKKLVNLEDFLFSIFIMVFAKNFASVTQPLYFYRNNLISITRQKSEHRFCAAALSFDLMQKVLDHPALKGQQELRKFAYEKIRRDKCNFYIYQRFSDKLVYLHQDSPLASFLPVYVQATIKAASFFNPLRCYSRMLTFIITFGLIKR